MRNINPIARRLGKTEGAEIAEAAVVLPLVFMLLLGIIWFGRVFNIWSTIQQAAQQGAITAARGSCETTVCGTAFPADGAVTGPAGTVAFAVATVMSASAIDPSKIVTSNPLSLVSCVNPPAPPPCGTASNIMICRQVLLNPPSSATQLPQCGVVVSFRYSYAFFLPGTSLNMQTITLSAQAQSKMEN